MNTNNNYSTNESNQLFENFNIPLEKKTLILPSDALCQKKKANTGLIIETLEIDRINIMNKNYTAKNSSRYQEKNFDEDFEVLKSERNLNNSSFRDSRIFSSNVLANENFNFNLIESKTAKDLKTFEKRIKNHDSPPIIFGYVNIIKNLIAKINRVDILSYYANLDILPSNFIWSINMLIKAFIIILVILFNFFLFKCDFFLRFNMYLILINDTKAVIDRGEIIHIVANIKRWFAFITIVILDELIKFLYFPEIMLNIWTCLMTIYLLIISGPESGVQFIIVSIYKCLRKLKLFL